tara:strand:+ start:54 stop:458 length:405 start_codon:yes stop_codon:yes gene_type:complete
MVLGIFKSKKKSKKDKLKAEIKNVGGGRSNQGKAKRLKRELKSLDAPKKEVKKGPRVGGAQANKRKNYGNNQTGGGGNTTNKKKVVKKSTMTGKERAQQMAKERIAAKKAGTYKAPKTAQQLAKERIAARKKKK